MWPLQKKKKQCLVMAPVMVTFKMSYHVYTNLIVFKIVQTSSTPTSYNSKMLKLLHQYLQSNDEIYKHISLTFFCRSSSSWLPPSVSRIEGSTRLVGECNISLPSLLICTSTSFQSLPVSQQELERWGQRWRWCIFQRGWKIWTPVHRQ